MHRIAAAAVVLLLVGACSSDSSDTSDTAGSEAFCDATRAIANLGEQSEMPPEVDTLVEEAPDEVKEAAETVRAGFQEAFDNQDPGALQTSEFQDAAKEVREYAVENCENVTDESS